MRGIYYLKYENFLMNYYLLTIKKTTAFTVAGDYKEIKYVKFYMNHPQSDLIRCLEQIFMISFRLQNTSVESFLIRPFQYHKTGFTA